jgi:dolichol-phosphate mannosyltransferase
MVVAGQSHPVAPFDHAQSRQDGIGASFPHPFRTSDTLIFVPTYNERDNIETLLDRVFALQLRCDVLVVDDRSKDGTLDILAARAAADRRVGVIVRRGKLGIGSAHKLGWLHARRLGYARFISLDADLSHDPADVPRLLAALDAGADAAIGSRFAPGGRLDYRGWRLFLSRTANLMARLLLRLPLAEYTTSFRAVRLDRVPPGLIETIDNHGYGFFLICATRLARQRLAIAEVPIHFRDRNGGKSKIPRLELVRGVVTLLSLAIWRRPTKPPGLPQGADAHCPSCGQSYRIVTPARELTCLACFDSRSKAVADDNSHVGAPVLSRRDAATLDPRT